MPKDFRTFGIHNDTLAARKMDGMTRSWRTFTLVAASLCVAALCGVWVMQASGLNLFADVNLAIARKQGEVAHEAAESAILQPEAKGHWKVAKLSNPEPGAIDEWENLFLDPDELNTKPEYEECGMVFLNRAFGLKPYLVPAQFDGQVTSLAGEALMMEDADGKSKPVVARVEGGGTGKCDASEIFLWARLVGDNAIVGLEPRAVDGTCAWEIPLKTPPRSGRYRLEVALLWYHEGGVWSLDDTSRHSCNAAGKDESVSSKNSTLPANLHGRVPKPGMEVPLYANSAENGRWISFCEWCRNTFFADRYLPEKVALDRFYNNHATFYSPGETAPPGAKSCAHLPRERYLGGLSISRDAQVRGRCRSLSTVLGSPQWFEFKAPIWPSAPSEESATCAAGTMGNGWWEVAEDTGCPQEPDRLDKQGVHKSFWPMCAHRVDFRKTAPGGWPCTGEWVLTANLRTGYHNVGIWPGSTQKIREPCTPQPCTCPASQLEDGASRKEAHTNFRWRGARGCVFRELSFDQVARCTQDLVLRWVLYDGVPPPLIWRDLELRYNITTDELKESAVKGHVLPMELKGDEVLIVESFGYLHAGQTGDASTLETRMRAFLVDSRPYTKDKRSRGRLIFMLSEAHHEWNCADSSASLPKGSSQPRQQAYHDVVARALKDSAWAIVDTFSPTRSRPTVRRPNFVSWGASGDGAQFGGVTVPFLHELCKRRVD